jgi:hypothetical protein
MITDNDLRNKADIHLGNRAATIERYLRHRANYARRAIAAKTEEERNDAIDMMELFEKRLRQSLII